MPSAFLSHPFTTFFVAAMPVRKLVETIRQYETGSANLPLVPRFVKFFDDFELA